MTTNRPSTNIVVAHRLTFDGHHWTYDGFRADGSILTQVTWTASDPVPPLFTPAPIHANVRLSDCPSRGRNGRFKAARAVIQTWNLVSGPIEISLDIWGNREGKHPPIVLEMSPEDAQALGQALAAVATVFSSTP